MDSTLCDCIKLGLRHPWKVGDGEQRWGWQAQILQVPSRQNIDQQN